MTITGANSQLMVDEVSGTIPNNFTLGGGGSPGSNNYGYGNATIVFHNDGQTATLSGTVTLAGDAKIRGYSSGGTTNFSNPIGGSGNLTLEAGGAIPQHTQYWVLGGSASTFTGNVLVSSDGSANSYLQLNGGALPSTAVLTLQDQSFAGGNNAVLDLNGYNQTLAGLTRIAGGGGLGSFVTNSGGSQSTLTINGSADSTFSGVIGANTAAAATSQGSGGDNIALVKTGSGTLTLSGTNTYTGTTTVSQGTLSVTGGLSGASSLTVASGATFQAVANNVFGQSGSTPTGSWTIAGTFQATAGNAAQTLPASVTLNGGTITSLADNAAYGSFINNGNTTIQATGASTLSARIGMFSTLTINTPASGDSLVVSGVLGSTFAGGSAGSLTKTGDGTLVLTGSNTYSGGTNITAGTLLANHATSSTGTGPVTVSATGRLGGIGATGNSTGNPVTIGTGGAIGTDGTISPGQTSIAAVTSTSSHVAPTTGDLGVLTTGDQTWNQGGTYVFKTTATTPNNSASKTDAMSAGNQDFVIVTGTLSINGNQFTSNAFTLNVEDPGLNGAVGTFIIAYANSVVIDGTTVVLSQDPVTHAYLPKDITPDFTIKENNFAAPATDTVQVIADGSGYDIQVTVPEPGSLGLLGVGALGLLRRRRVSRAQSE